MFSDHLPPSPSCSSAKPAASRTASAAEAAVDADLVRQFNAGDEGAFTTIMQRHRHRIFNLTVGLLHDRADAEEITQDTFIRAHRGLANFRCESSLATWLYRIAVNLARNRYWYFHRRRRHDMLSLEHEIGPDGSGTFSDLIADPDQDPARQTATGEFAALIEACLGQLDARHREILVLRNALNRSYGEIAATLGLNIGTVKSRLARARENLRARLAANCPEFAPDAAPGEWFLPTRALYDRPVIASS
jgi:RNA polymerase sigma-70 factor (ECF subfamily)